VVLVRAQLVTDRATVSKVTATAGPAGSVTKLQHWYGFSGKNGWKAAPVLVFQRQGRFRKLRLGVAAVTD